MADVPDEAGDSGGISAARTAEVVGGYLASVVVLLYPIGLLSLTLQLWVAYEYPILDSLYAAALAPVPTAMAQIFYSLYWFLSSYILAEYVSGLLWQKSATPLLPMIRGERLQSIILVVLIAIAPPIVIRPEYILTLKGVTLWVGFVLSALAGGIIGGLLHRDAGARWPRLAANLAVYLFAILGAVLLTGTEGPHLPLVELGGEECTEARLLSHSNGYWYVFDPEDGLSAVPDDEAGRVQFLRE